MRQLEKRVEALESDLAFGEELRAADIVRMESIVAALERVVNGGCMVNHWYYVQRLKESRGILQRMKAGEALPPSPGGNIVSILETQRQAVIARPQQEGS